MSCKPLLIVATGSLLALSACDTVHPNGSVDPGFGEVARYNAALMTIDPDPQVAANAMQPGSNGATSAAAAKRFRTDAVKPVEKVQTTQKSESGGN